MGILVVLSLLAALGACSPEVLPPSGPHPALTPEQVKIYSTQPSKYERLGTVNYLVTSSKQWKENADATPAFTDLLAQAAQQGANGLLLIDDTHEATVEAGASYAGKYYLVPVKRDPTTVIVQAIYVLKE
jgi:hypothetical protein